MVNKRTWLGILVIMLVFGMTVIACNNDTENERDSRLVLESGYAWVDDSEAGVIFKSDGTFQAIGKIGSFWEIDFTGKWSTSGNKSLTFNSDTSPYTVIGNTLTWDGVIWTKTAVTLK
jgi:hypothetical protein